jgi:hypothetical protein
MLNGKRVGSRLGARVRLVCLAGALLTMGGCFGSSGPSIERFRAILNGQNEVPPVTTSATGLATFAVIVDVTGKRITYTLEATNITGITAAHIHSGAAGTSGPVVVTLFSTDPPTGSVNGQFATGNIRADDVQGMWLEELLNKMRDGTVYVNVHTTANPGGEIRGQVGRQ